MQIADQYSILLYPFELSEIDDLKHNLQLAEIPWEISDKGPDHSYLFDHVYRFLATNRSKTMQDLDMNECILLKLKKGHEHLRLQEKLFRHKHTLTITNDTGADVKFDFSFFDDSSNLSPQIIMIPMVGIGFLTVGFKVENNDINSNDYLYFLNALRVIALGRISEFETALNPHPNANIGNLEILQLLGKYTNTNPEYSNGTIKWSLKTYIQYLTDNWANKISFIGSPRLQLFTYTHLQLKSEQQPKLNSLLYRLAKVYSPKYKLPLDLLSQSNHVQPFEEVHFAAFKEGAAILIDEDFVENKQTFLSEYGRQVALQTMFWSWLTAHIQYYALLNAANKVSLIDLSARQSIQRLRSLIRNLNQIQIRCIFSQISHHTTFSLLIVILA